MSIITIDVVNNGDNPHFIIRGLYDDLLKNKRLLISFKRLKYTSDNKTIRIPFLEVTQVQILQELQRLLDKFGYDQKLTKKTKQDVESFVREEASFNEFAELAKLIRNNEFDDNLTLVGDFDQFQEVLKRKLSRELYPLQLLSAFHMAFAQNSCNFAVPGAGKTSIVYGAYAYLKNLPKENEKHVDKLLIVGPISSFKPWEDEYEFCFDRRTSFKRLSGSDSFSRKQKLEHLYSGNPSEVTLVFHGGVDHLQEDIVDFLKRNKTMVVVDEAHRIKNPEGVWGQSVTEISKEAISRVVLTGTPVPNGYQDLFNLFKFIYPYKFKDILQFHYQNLVEMTQSSKPDSGAVQELKNNLSPFFIRIKKDDLELPPFYEHVISVDMEPYQREIYDFIESSYIDSFKKNDSGTVKDILNKAKLIRLRQASTNPALLTRTLEDALENNQLADEFDPNSQFAIAKDELVEDSVFFYKISNYSSNEIPRKFSEILTLLQSKILPENEKVIIWTIFIQNAKELQTFLLKNNIKSKLLIGEIEQQERERTIAKFNIPENLEFQVVIANPFAVAESISLHMGCHNAIYMERDYNCSNFLQSKDRIHRVGLPKDQVTNYYYIISKDSIDEIIDSRLREKIERMEKIIDDDIPLFMRIDDQDETDIIRDLIANYAQRP